ncbi:28 kDa ribonucleoprotein, chloroplastic [Canna indica]|uniref:28 kDa ribonucleoprotein, chloroplastic n=1 Tax=Canna indica TaxID=4628 RepID=A0AAQ3QPF8_9LILI|nr:28 kDa ribonucleoprotein, chloroplastic [Canna indica]
MASAAAAAAAAFFCGTLPFPRTKIYSSVRSSIPIYAPVVFSNPRSFSLLPPCPPPVKKQARGDGFRRCSVVQDVALEKEAEKETAEKRRKLYVTNLPWDFSGPNIEELFGQYGTVKDVEIIKQNNGKSRGFAFVTMASGEEAQAALDKLDSYELKGRVIRVDFAKSFRKPAPPPPPGAIAREPRHKIYVSNLAWKARSVNLKEFFSAKFNPLSARVVFQNPTGRSAGYGFVGFATEEEAEAAISELDGKELLGRPVRLRISQRTTEQSVTEPEAESTDEQSQTESEAESTYEQAETDSEAESTNEQSEES